MVAVIVILGVLAVTTTQFIGQGVGIYADTIRRDNLQQQARFASERISRELANALPGSVRVGSSGSFQCIEFVPIITASSYINPIARVGAISSLDIIDVGYDFVSGDSLAIYTLDNARVYGASSNLTALTGESSGPQASTRTVSFAAKSFSEESPSQRAFIVNSPVSFCAEDNSLTRHENYGFSASQQFPPESAVPMAEHLRINDGGVYTVFDYVPDSLQRAAIIKIDLRFFDSSEADEWLRLIREVSLRNTP
jgi:MSHA biogenesis protein MshO